MAKWTFDQKAAIDIRGANLLISAAAGSGKTAVLVERITQLIQSKEAEIHKLLIVTYTNAAASEMRGRIESALSSAIEKNQGDAAILNDQIKLLGRANIKTFHAFCLDIIRNHFQKIDCDPGFKMLGEPERTIMIRQAIEEVLEDQFQIGDASFLDLVDAYSGNRNDEKLIELILQIYQFIQSQAHPQKWLEENLLTYSDASHPLRKEWVELLRLSFVEKIEGAIELLENAIELCTSTGGPECYIPSLESDIRGLSRILDASEDMVSFGEAIMSFKFDRIASIKKNERELYDEDLIVEVKDNIRDKIVKKQVFESIKSFFSYKTMARFESEIGGLKDRVEQLCHLTIAFSTRFQELKKKRNLMDFNDLEHYAIDILEDQAICESLRRKFDFIFVDEYQDSSGIQEHIISKISRQNNVFMVGDVKQSIYKFRLADPELFIEKYKRFDKLESLLPDDVKTAIQQKIEFDETKALAHVNSKLAETSSQNFVRIDLKMNFRTRGEVLKRINQIFENIMSEKLGEIAYDADARLYPGMAFDEPRMPYFEINILTKKGLTDDSELMGLSESTENADGNEYLEEDVEEILKTEELEANAIANAIKSRIGTMVFDPKAQVYKPCTFRDIVVLLRSSRSWTPTFEQVFLDSGIPLFADSNTGYFDTLEIKMVMALLRVIDNPLQDLALLTVLRSPMVKLSIEEILIIKAQTDKKTYFYEKMMLYLESDEQNSELTQKIVAFLELLEVLRQHAQYLPLDELVWMAIQKSDFYYYVSAMPGGVSRQANLKLLVDRATALKGSRILTLSHFIEFVDKMSTNSGDFGVANVISEEDNVVRLMSIHKSKGLEFPIVIISGLGRKFNFMDAQGDLIQHKRLGLGLSQVDLELRTKSKTLPQFAIRDQIRRETLSEEMRVLYVGLTRPVDQLLLFATVSDYQKKQKQWRRATTPLSLSSANGFIDWIMPSLLDTSDVKITVHDQESLAQAALNTETVEIKQVDRWHQIQNQTIQIEAHTKDEIVQRLSFNWSIDEAEYKPIKITVSEKKKEFFSEDVVYQTPVLSSFLKVEQALSAAEIGTAIHTVLEKIDLNMEPTLYNLTQFIALLKDKHLLSVKEVEAINLNNILKYMNSSLVSRLKRSLAYHRETPFVLKMDGQFVQGIIDLYFEESDGIILVDYKSDKVTHDSIANIASRYKVQIDIYQSALEKLTQKIIKEKYIYFIDSDMLYPM